MDNTIAPPPMIEEEEYIGTTKAFKFSKKLTDIFYIFSRIFIGISVFSVIQFILGIFFYEGLTILCESIYSIRIFETTVYDIWKSIRGCWFISVVVYPLVILFFTVTILFSDCADKKLKPLKNEKIPLILISPIPVIFSTFFINYLDNFSLCYVSF